MLGEIKYYGMMEVVMKYDEKVYEEYLLEYDKTIKKLVKYSYDVYGMDKDDLEQELRMVLLNCVDKFNHNKGVKFSTYFITACHNKIRRLQILAKRENLTSLDKIIAENKIAKKLYDKRDSYKDNLSSDDKSLEEQYIMDKVYKLIDNHPYGKFVRMYYFDKLNGSEIAEIEGVTKATVYNRINDVLNFVKKELGL